MEEASKRPTLVTKLQREQYVDLLRIVPEEVFAEFNASLEKAKKRLMAELHDAMRKIGPDVHRDRDQFHRLLVQLRVFLDDEMPRRAGS
jgi:hypothetical protein